jgi:hypothetical protein
LPKEGIMKKLSGESIFFECFWSEVTLLLFLGLPFGLIWFFVMILMFLISPKITEYGIMTYAILYLSLPFWYWVPFWLRWRRQ